MTAADVEALTEALARPLEDWDRRTLDYAVSHIYSAWPENRNLDRDAFLNELIYYIERLRDERDDERASLASELAQVVAARATERERELRALVERIAADRVAELERRIGELAGEWACDLPDHPVTVGTDPSHIRYCPGCHRAARLRALLDRESAETHREGPQ